MANLLKYFPEALILSGLLLLPGCRAAQPFYQKTFTPTEKAQLAHTLTEGIGNYYQGSPATIFLLQEALCYDSTYADIWREIGVPYLKRGLITAFPSTYGKAADLDPVGWQGWRGYLYLYFYRDYRRALADFDATDTLTPNLVDYPQSMSVDYLRGICYLQLNDYEKALAYLDTHINYETERVGLKYLDAQAFLYKGIALLALERPEAAQAAFELGLMVEAGNADLLYWLAKTLLQRGQGAQAEILLREAMEQFKKGKHNTTTYVEEFYQTYWPDLEALAAQLKQ